MWEEVETKGRLGVLSAGEETTGVLPGRRRDSALRADLWGWSEL